MNKKRLDTLMVEIGLVRTRSQAESYIRLGEVSVNGQVINKPGYMVPERDYGALKLHAEEQYVSRAALKLASVAEGLHLDFKDKTVLDVGSSTGGFTDYSIRKGAKKVIAVDSGTEQLYPSLRNNPKIDLHEKTDIREFITQDKIDIVLIDVSFISIREILPGLRNLIGKNASVVAMVKPQFEAGQSSLKHKGVIKNDKMRRQIFKEFEEWLRPYYLIKDKLDSSVSGAKGNLERFYLIQKA
jgi:23S rRNA (cytidine1920-2'-O)/16S rRNA (cytidine1409-2'-O)-methyltransferase